MSHSNQIRMNSKGRMRGGSGVVWLFVSRKSRPIMPMKTQLAFSFRQTEKKKNPQAISSSTPTPPSRMNNRMRMRTVMKISKSCNVQYKEKNSNRREEEQSTPK